MFMIKKNTEYITELIHITLYLAKQGLAFRGHRERKSSLNLLELIELTKSKTPNSILADPSIKHKYLGHNDQDDLIECIAAEVRSLIVEEA